MRDEIYHELTPPPPPNIAWLTPWPITEPATEPTIELPIIPIILGPPLAAGACIGTPPAAAAAGGGAAVRAGGGGGGRAAGGGRAEVPKPACDRSTSLADLQEFDVTSSWSSLWRSGWSAAINERL